MSGSHASSRLEALPTELIEEIAGLPKNKDLNSLRLVSRRFRAATCHQFTERLVDLRWLLADHTSFVQGLRQLRLGTSRMLNYHNDPQMTYIQQHFSRFPPATAIEGLLRLYQRGLITPGLPAAAGGFQPPATVKLFLDSMHEYTRVHNNFKWRGCLVFGMTDIMECPSCMSPELSENETLWHHFITRYRMGLLNKPVRSKNRMSWLPVLRYDFLEAEKYYEFSEERAAKGRRSKERGYSSAEEEDNVRGMDVDEDEEEENDHADVPGFGGMVNDKAWREV
ncbi:hypothetical protein B0T17DRAFT_503874 [Bombardia bombarda]|uniref:F-box domain-containing protein n=1 Tax=Bombardia bombarda TaxID=252184 RepID=A0AA39XNT6_9PEZI|nr:hypothetical protein B0T17DRAFT_503874 [Bombardia bombarda]